MTHTDTHTRAQGDPNKPKMTTLFDVKEYVVDGQHIREYARATAHSQEEVLKVAVKQYTPRDNPNPQPGDITIIASHANGFVKVARLSLASARLCG